MGWSSSSSSSSSKSSVQLKGKQHNSKCSARGGKQLPGTCHKLSAESHAIQFPGALPVKQVIYARYHSNEWRQATVIHCRRRRHNVDEDDFLPLPQSYDYYVHWVKMDRRLDTWLPWEDLHSLDSPLPADDILVLPRDIPCADDDHGGMDEEYLREHEESTKVKTIDSVAIGDHCVQTWYYSPYPKEFQNIDVLHVCEFCLSFFRHAYELSYHSRGCTSKSPPANEIFRDEKNQLSMWEVDGCLCRVYCENLCYLSKLFLDHKTLKHPVNLFLFYVLTEIRETGFHIVGYFSKEKYSKNNLSCICILPQHQRKGYGKFLINFSYALSRRERKRGTPERPLSDLGKASYVAYWTRTLVESLTATSEMATTSVEELADATFLDPNDINSTLQTLGVIQRHVTAH